MPGSEDEKLYGIEYKLTVLSPPLTRAEMRKARKDYIGSGYCRAAVVLALMGPGALIVEASDSRGLAPGPMSAQTQFELWLLWTRQLEASGEIPHAMKQFLSRVLESYKVECSR